MVVFNEDFDQVYYFSDEDKVASAIVNAVSVYIDGHGPKDVVEFTDISEAIKASMRVMPYVPLKIGETTAYVHRLEFDRFSTIHSVLSDAWSVLNRLGEKEPDARLVSNRIAALFREPQVT